MNRINATRFMTQEEMKEKYNSVSLDGKETCNAAGVPLLVSDKKVYIDTEDNHTIIFGSTGSKKTRLFGMPTVELLSRAGESFIVTDPKGEIYERSSAQAAARGYQIFCLNLRDFRKGVTWNPLALPYDYYHRGEKSKAIEMVSEFAKFLVGECDKDPFWPNTAMDVIIGLILILLESADKSECHMKSVLELWESYLENKSKWLSLVKIKYGNSLIKRKLSSLDNESERTVGSIEAFVAMGLNKLIVNEDFVSFLSQDGMDLNEVTQKKTAIYLIIPDENKFYHFIASVFMEQLYEVLIKEAQKQPKNRLKIRMNYIIDEFANIPKMQNMDSMITAGRSRNIRFNLIIQSKMQLEEKYGEMASVICDNCNNWIYLYSKDYDLLNEISKLCGTVIYDNNMTVPLISEFDLQHLKKDEGEALVLAGRNYPCIVNLADIDEYPVIECNNAEGIFYETQKWYPINVFFLKKDSPRRLYVYEDRIVRAKGLLKEFIRDNTWLVGTCNGMIFVEELVNEEDVKSGIAILKLCLNKFSELSEAKELTWYTSHEIMSMTYYDEMKKHPEKVFMTIDELGKDNFQIVKNNLLEKIVKTEETGGTKYGEL